MVEGRSYLQVWGLTHQLRSVQDATPAQIVRRRKSVKPYGQAEQAKNQGIAEDVGYAPPVIDSDGGMYPRISAPYRPVHDPHPAAFIFLTIEIFLRDREVYRALAQRVYIHAKDVGHFRYRQVLRDELIGETGIWLVASQRSAEREHAKLRKAIAELFEESYEPSIAQKAAKELLGELSEAEKIKRRYERRKAKRERIQKRHENVEPIIDDSRLLYMGCV